MAPAHKSPEELRGIGHPVSCSRNSPPTYPRCTTLLHIVTYHKKAKRALTNRLPQRVLDRTCADKPALPAAVSAFPCRPAHAIRLVPAARLALALPVCPCYGTGNRLPRPVRLLLSPRGHGRPAGL